MLHTIPLYGEAKLSDADIDGSAWWHRYTRVVTPTVHTYEPGSGTRSGADIGFPHHSLVRTETYSYIAVDTSAMRRDGVILRYHQEVTHPNVSARILAYGLKQYTLVPPQWKHTFTDLDCILSMLTSAQNDPDWRNELVALLAEIMHTTGARS